MANHVSYQVWFREMNDAAKARWKEMTDNLHNDKQDGYEYWFADLFVDNKEGSPTLDEVRQYSWTTEEIGPKWCYIQDFDEESFHGYSAWSEPTPALEWILSQLAPLDPQMITSITHEDEMPNFIGAYVYKGTEIVDGAEDDGNEIVEYVLDGNPELKEHWDEDTDDWVTDEDGNYTEASEEASDTYNEVLYEWISIRQDEIITETLEYMEEE